MRRLESGNLVSWVENPTPEDLERAKRFRDLMWLYSISQSKPEGVEDWTNKRILLDRHVEWLRKRIKEKEEEIKERQSIHVQSCD